MYIFIFVLMAAAVAALVLLWFRAKTSAAIANTNLASEVKARTDLQARLDEVERAARDMQKQFQITANEAAKIPLLTEQIKTLERALASTRTNFETSDRQTSDLRQANALMQQDVEFAKRREEEVKQLLVNAKEAFGTIAGEVLGEKSKTLSEHNSELLGAILKPFGQNLKDFKEKVEEIQRSDIAERTSLKSQITQLTSLNQLLGSQAKSLTEALQGQSKVRGTWGEHILTKMLEDCGLREGHEFRTQVSFQTEDGKRLQPDVVVSLPQNRFIVIDSKVSLLAYLRYIEADDESERDSALQEHLASMRRHINDLSKKDYSRLYDVESPDYVLMFVPVEPALMLAMQAEPNLSNDSLVRRVALVSPNTLYAVLHTVEYLWQVERRSKNMDEIRKRGGLLYDAAVRFTESMEDIGKGINQASEAYLEARRHLTDQSRGVIRQAERLRSLGVSHKKQMPNSFKDELGGMDLTADDLPQLENIPSVDEHASEDGEDD